MPRRWQYEDNFYGGFYERRSAIEAKGGIKAQSKRGQFGESWWARRWIHVLESFNIGGRLSRGRSYARKGQVLSIDVSKGRVTATVQGSRPKPYEVAIQVTVLTAAEWSKLATTLGSQAIFAAKLMAGEMPQDIEQAFQAAGLSLFPEKLRDLKTHCSCPDSSNPCKHIAAVYYLLGEEFDRDPFLIFTLRGVNRQEMVEMLGTTAGISSASDAGSSFTEDRPTSEKVAAEKQAIPEPLTADLATFWEGAPLPEEFFGEVNSPPVSAALPKRLGSFPFWRGAERFLEAMEQIYGSAGSRGMSAFLGEAGVPLEEAPRTRPPKLI